MPERIQTLRSSVKGSRPTGRQPGELYTNFADRQIGVVNASNVATDLVAVRYFSTAADYAIGDFVIEAGTMYRAKVAVTAGAFNAANWDAVATFASAASGFVVKTGDTMTGNLIVSNPSSHAILGLSKPITDGLANQFDGMRAGVMRWRMNMGNAAAETGSNVGSDFSLIRMTDAGTGNGSVLNIPRSTGIADFPLGVTTPTPPVGDNDTSVATTQFVTRADGSTPVVPKVDTTAPFDWNTVTTAGWHSVLGDSGGANSPPASGYFFVQVLLFASANITQIAYPYSASEAVINTLNRGVWYRGRYSGVWSAWKQLAPATAEARNRFVNGAFQISQEWGDTGVATNQYPADQWLHFNTGISVGCARALTGARLPNGSNRAVYISVLTAKPSLAAADQLGILQKIEGINLADLNWGGAYAKPVVVRFWMIAPVTGTFTLSIRNGALNRAYLAPITIPTAGTWTKIEIVIPGDTTGTWDTDTGVGLWFTICVAGGTNSQGVAGWSASAAFTLNTATNGATATGAFYFSDFGFYADPSNTGLAPPWQLPDEAEELRACKRYYDKDLFGIFTGDVTSGSNYYNSAYLNVTPRPGATVSMVNVSNTLFPATALALALINNGIREQRGPATTSAVGIWQANYVVNGRM